MVTSFFEADIMYFPNTLAIVFFFALSVFYRMPNNIFFPYISGNLLDAFHVLLKLDLSNAI
jgi:hypothetical protein